MRTRFSKTHGFWNTNIPAYVDLKRVQSQFRAGLFYGLELAAQACRTHIVQFARKHGENSPHVHASEVNLYCIERALRKKT